MGKINALLVILLVCASGLLAQPNFDNHYSEKDDVAKLINGSDGIVHQIRLYPSNNSVFVSSTNTQNWNDKVSGYNIKVDNQRVYNADLRLDSGEEHTETINITPGINVNQNNHTVTFSTYGNYTQFNFTREINSSNSGDVPTPHIANVEVTNGTAKGQPSAVANVTLVNPSEQLYSTKLMVHTVGTDGSLYPASVRPGDTRTITVELLDQRGAEIAGEARLYTGNMTTREGAIDQVEFAGQAGEDTAVWNTSYEPVKPTWMDDNYEYENESYEQGLDEKLSAGHEIDGVPVVYAAVALLAGMVAIRKLR